MPELNRPRLEKFAVACASAAVSFLVYGYSYSSNPNLIQILPFADKLAGRALFPADPYILSFSSFPSFYPRLIASLSLLFPMEPLHFLLYCAVRLFFMYAVYGLVETLFRDRITSIVSCLLVALSPLANVFTFLGEDPVMKTSLYQTSFVAPFAVIAITKFLEGKNTAAFLLTAAIYYFNGLVGNFLLAIFAAHALIGGEYKKFIRPFVFFLLAVLPWAVWQACLKNIFSGAGPEYIALLRQWYPGHYFPISWNFARWRDAISFLAVFWLVISAGLNFCTAPRVIKNFMAAFAAMWAAAFVFGEILLVRHIIVLQFLRSDSLFILIGLVFAARYAAEGLKSAKVRDWACGLLAVVCLSEVAQPVFCPYIAVFLAADRYAPKAKNILALVFIVIAAFYMKLYGAELLKLSAIVLLFAAVITDGLDFGPGLVYFRRFKYIAAAILVFAPFVSTMSYRLFNNEYDYKEPDIKNWEAVQKWARNNTPEETVFITPAKYTGFRVLSLRSPVSEWIDGAAMHWAPGFEKQWFERQRALGGIGALPAIPSNDVEKEMLEMHFSILTNERIIETARRYGAGYLVTGRASNLNFPAVYSNSTFKVLKLNY